MTPRSAFVSIAIIGTFAVSRAARAQDPSGDAVPKCATEKEAEWDGMRELSRRSLGIIVPGTESPPLGSVDRPPVRATDTVHDWTPKDILKQTFCGTLDHVGFFHNITAEYDWNNYIDPWDRYGIFAEHPNAQPCQQHPQHTCIEAEITPPEKLRRNNQWWNWDAQSSALIGRSICVYGPWVGDGGHGDRPEIHPTEVFWWREKEVDLRKDHADGVPFYILLVQDASARYGHRRQYVFEGAAPPNWEPWVPRELKHTFILPFLKHRQDKEPVTFDVQADGQGARPRTDRSTRGGWKGVVQTTVYGELGAGVAATTLDVCDRKDGGIQGLLSIDASVGVPVCESCEAEGFAAIRVTRNSGSSPQSRFRLGVERLATFLEAEPTEPAVPVTDSQTNNDVWQMLLQAVGHRSDSNLPAPKLVRVPGWKLTVRPRAGEDPARFSVSWQVKQRRAGGRTGAEAVVTKQGKERGRLKGAEITVEFPDDARVAEVLVKADVSDDRQVPVGSIVWHAFSHGAQSVERRDPPHLEDIRSLLTVAARLAVVDPKQFLELTGEPSRTSTTDPIPAVVRRRARSTLYDIGKGGVISLEDIRWLACEARKSQLADIRLCDDKTVAAQHSRSWDGPLRLDDCCIARLTTFPKAR